MDMDIGSRIKKAREAAGLTQDDIGAAVGKRGLQISRWEHNKVDKISGRALAEIARITGCDYAWLTTGAGSPPRARRGPVAVEAVARPVPPPAAPEHAATGWAANVEDYLRSSLGADTPFAVAEFLRGMNGAPDATPSGVHEIRVFLEERWRRQRPEAPEAKGGIKRPKAFARGTGEHNSDPADVSEDADLRETHKRPVRYQPQELARTGSDGRMGSSTPPAGVRDSGSRDAVKLED